MGHLIRHQARDEQRTTNCSVLDGHKNTTKDNKVSFCPTFIPVVIMQKQVDLCELNVNLVYTLKACKFE